MTSLTDFLLERVAEDEAVAQKGVLTEGQLEYLWREFERARVPGAVERLVVGWHDPARVLAECAAKRAIVEVVSAWKHEVVEDCWYTCGAATEERDGGQCCDDARRRTGCDCGLDFRVGAILKPLANIFADHPDFDPAWRLP